MKRRLRCALNAWQDNRSYANDHIDAAIAEEDSLRDALQAGPQVIGAGNSISPCTKSGGPSRKTRIGPRAETEHHRRPSEASNVGFGIAVIADQQWTELRGT